MRDGFETEQAVRGGKRLSVKWTPWMGDWFVSHSPRNGNSNAEGQWDQWVDLACKILRDPLTQITRPDAYAVAHQPQFDPKEYYSEVAVELTEAYLDKRFPQRD